MGIFLACRVSRSSVVEAWHSYLEQRKLAWNFKKLFIPHTETFGGALVLWVSPRTCNKDLVQLEGKTKTVSYEGWPYLLVPSQEWRNCLMLASASPILQTRHFCSSPSDACFVIFWSLKVILFPLMQEASIQLKLSNLVHLKLKSLCGFPPSCPSWNNDLSALFISLSLDLITSYMLDWETLTMRMRLPCMK